MKNKILILFLVFFIQESFAQVKDFGVWTSVSLQKNVNPRLNFCISESIRFNENANQLSQHFSNISGEFNISKNLSFTSALRFSQKFKYDETLDFRYRFQLGLAYKIKVKNIEINLEERFQSQLENLKRMENWDDPTTYLRSRITLKYNLKKKIEPFISSELFYNLGEHFDNVRSRLGFSYELNKFNSFKTFYMIDKEFNVKNPKTNYVLGFAYKFSF